MDEELRHLRKRVASDQYPTPRRACSFDGCKDKVEFVCSTHLQWFACANHADFPARPIEEFFDEVRNVG